LKEETYMTAGLGSAYIVFVISGLPYTCI